MFFRETDSFTNMRSLLGALAESMNLINPDVSHHHEQTAYLAYLIATDMQLPRSEVNLTVYAALLHDVGSVVQGRQKSVSEIQRDAKAVSMAGAVMCYGLQGFERIGDVIAYCQFSQDEMKVVLEMANEKGQTDQLSVIRVASIIHLADKVSLMIRPYEPVLIQSKRIREAISRLRNVEFDSETVDSFLRIVELEYVWMDMMHHPNCFLDYMGEIEPLTLKSAVHITHLMSRIVDSKSPFTAMHSAGVSASASKLAELAGMSDRECQMMAIAGYLHDLGKLVVPKHILEKPGKLTDDEFGIIKEHPYYTRMILSQIDGFEQIANWAGNHHEKLNGRGYPYHLHASELDLGSRMMSVADIFSAITEVRPYRAGMKKDMAIKVMKENVEFGAIDHYLVQLLLDHYEEVDTVRDTISREEGVHYFQSLTRENEIP